MVLGLQGSVVVGGSGSDSKVGLSDATSTLTSPSPSTQGRSLPSVPNGRSFGGGNPVQTRRMCSVLDEDCKLSLLLGVGGVVTSSAGRVCACLGHGPGD